MACGEALRARNVLVLDFDFHLNIALQFNNYGLRAGNCHIQIHQDSCIGQNSLAGSSFIKAEGFTNGASNGQQYVATPTMVDGCWGDVAEAYWRNVARTVGVLGAAAGRGVGDSLSEKAIFAEAEVGEGRGNRGGKSLL
ncbi:hypothetical protein MRB53_005084 [Persea americana]|uniref:Uncharacterized protein n=1 Tax=Persea americana TaxID=3435 RepID=A0ACC2MCG9_PERAE|nr:hypothetical protein MRB53_005084 [Persea americana]